jgi:tryptophan synthase alpha chain
MSLRLLLEHVRSLRQEVAVPIVLMGYLNPILRYGSERFFADAASAGVDGIILPELPLEEGGRFAEVLRKSGLAQILLVTPTTPPERLRAIDALATGFVYCVSMTGVTGGQVAGEISGYLRRVRENATRNPMLVGFGISTPEQAAAMGREADGVIIGSALIRELEKSGSEDELVAWVRGFRDALDRV